MARVTGLNSKTLQQGSVKPSLSKDTLRCYNMRFCPYAERTLLALLAKEISFEVVNVNTRQKPDWFVRLNPLGKVPVLEQNGMVLYESAVCNDYLEETVALPAILPSAAVGRAKQKMLAERLRPLEVSLLRLAYRSQEPWAMEKLNDSLIHCQSLLTADFYGGVEPLWADYMTFPWLERVDALRLLYPGQVLPRDRLPRLTDYAHRFGCLPRLSAAVKPAEQHARFIVSNRTGNADYDIGIESAHI